VPILAGGLATTPMLATPSVVQPVWSENLGTIHAVRVDPDGEQWPLNDPDLGWFTVNGPSPAPTAAASQAPSAAAPIGNTTSTCTAVKTFVNDDSLDPFGRQLGSLVTARELANAEAEKVATNGIRTVTGTWAAQLIEFQQGADDPALRTALGTLATSLTTLGSPEYLAGVKTFEDAGRAISMIDPGLTAVEKICG
jgi:hypothetical protein